MPEPIVKAPGMLATASDPPGRVAFAGLGTVNFFYVPRRGHTVSAYDVVATAAGTLQLFWVDPNGLLHALGTATALTASAGVFVGSAQLNRPIGAVVVAQFVSTAGAGTVFAFATDDLR